MTRDDSRKIPTQQLRANQGFPPDLPPKLLQK